jgi:uncharacterized protein (DUF2141 family)
MPKGVATIRTVIAAVSLATLSAAPAPVFVEVSVEGQRNARGVLRACLTRDPAHFPECEGDPAAVSASVSASDRRFRLGPVARGAWALALFHDENGNGKLDTVLGVPKEGFAFSRNPPLTFGPPKFDRASVTVGERDVEAPVRLRYLL